MPDKWARTAAVLTTALALVALTASLAGGRGPETASRNLPAVLSVGVTEGVSAPLPALPALPALANPDPEAAPGGAGDAEEVGALLHDVVAIRKALLSLQSRELSREHSALKPPSAAPTTEAAADESEPTSVRAPALSPPASPEKGHARGAETRPRQTNHQRQRQPLHKQPQRAQRGADEPGPKSAGFVNGLGAHLGVHQRLADSEPLARRTLDLKVSSVSSCLLLLCPPQPVLRRGMRGACSCSAPSRRPCPPRSRPTLPEP